MIFVSVGKRNDLFRKVNADQEVIPAKQSYLMLENVYSIRGIKRVFICNSFSNDI